VIALTCLTCACGGPPPPLAKPAVITDTMRPRHPPYPPPRPALAPVTLDFVVLVDPRDFEAKQHFERGEAHFRAGDFAAAVQELIRSYERAPEPELILDIALCKDRMGDYRDATYFYLRYLKLWPDAYDRDQVQRRIDELNAWRDAPQ